MNISQQAMNRWNSLSQEDIDATSLICFKNRTERLRRNFQQIGLLKGVKSTSPTGIIITGITVLHVFDNAP